MLDNIKAVIFDMDGTLIDSMWLWKAIDIEYLARFNHTLPDDLQAAIEGKSFTETALYFKERFGIEDDVETIKSDWNNMAWEFYRDRVTLKEGALDFLKQLREQGIKTGIGTSNSTEMVKLILDKFELAPLFDSVRTSCEVAKGKPSPDIYLKVAEDIKVDPSDCLVFEDVPMGIMAANNAGMRSCAIYDDFSADMDDEKKKLADHYLGSYTELLVQTRKEA